LAADAVDPAEVHWKPGDIRPIRVMAGTGQPSTTLGMLRRQSHG